MNKEQLHRFISGSTGNESNICQIHVMSDFGCLHSERQLFRLVGKLMERKMEFTDIIRIRIETWVAVRVALQVAVPGSTATRKKPAK